MKAEIRTVDNGYIVTTWPVMSPVEKVFHELESALMEISKAVGKFNVGELNGIEIHRNKQ